MTEVSRNFWNNSILLLSSRIAAKLTTMIVVVVTARVLGVEDFGVYNSIISLSIFAGLISDFGLLMPSIRSIASSERSRNNIVSRSIPYRMALSGMACVVIMIGGATLHLDLGIVLLLSIASIFEFNGMTFIRSLEGIKEFQRVSLYTVIERLLYGSCAIAALMLFPSVYSLAWGIVIAHAAFFVIALRVFRRSFGSISIRVQDLNFIEYFKIGLPFFLTTIFSNIYYKADTLIIGSITSMHDVGIYNAAMRIIDAQMMVPITMMVSVFPQLSQLYHRQSAEFRPTIQKYFFILTSSGIVFAVITFAGSEIFIHLLYSDAFDASVVLLQILSIMLLFFHLNALFFQTLISMHKEIIFTGIMLFSALASIVGNISLLPHFGISATAWIRVGIEISTCLFAGLYILYFFIRRAQSSVMPLKS